MTRASRFSCCCAQVRPLEETYKFGSFFSPMLTESDFDAKPSVLLLGQYSTGVPPTPRGMFVRSAILCTPSVRRMRQGTTQPALQLRTIRLSLTLRCLHSYAARACRSQRLRAMCPPAGKTTFIKYLLGGRDYPGINIGPEPTTDRFVVVEHGLEERRTPGNTLVVQPSKPYQASRPPCKGAVALPFAVNIWHRGQQLVNIMRTVAPVAVPVSAHIHDAERGKRLTRSSACCAGSVHLRQRLHEQVRSGLMSGSSFGEHHPRGHARCARC